MQAVCNAYVVIGFLKSYYCHMTKLPRRRFRTRLVHMILCEFSIKCPLTMNCIYNYTQLLEKHVSVCVCAVSYGFSFTPFALNYTLLT